MLIMALLPPGGLLGGYGGDPDGVNGSWEKACSCVSTSISIRVRVAVAAGEYGLYPLDLSGSNHVHVFVSILSIVGYLMLTLVARD